MTIDTSDAVKELLQATMPPLREPGDMERYQIELILEEMGYEIRNRNQIGDILRDNGFESMWVWDNAVKGQVQVWRKIQNEGEN